MITHSHSPGTLPSVPRRAFLLVSPCFPIRTGADVPHCQKTCCRLCLSATTPASLRSWIINALARGVFNRQGEDQIFDLLHKSSGCGESREERVLTVYFRYVG